MKVYVASKSPQSVYALNPDNIIEACSTGPNPLADAESYAKDYTRAEDKRSYVYAVEISPVRGFKLEKAVASFVTTQ